MGRPKELVERASVGPFAPVIASIRMADGMAQAFEGLAAAGRLAGILRPSVIDDVCRDHPLEHNGELMVEKVLGWPRVLTQWWYGNRLAPHYSDAQRCLTEALPFVSELLEGGGRSRTKTDSMICSHFRNVGVASAIIVPVHLPGGKTSMVSWSSDAPGMAQSAIEDYPELIAVANCFIAAIETIRVPRENLKLLPLTPRQRECITLASRGLTTKEIGRRLDLSHHTVAEYLTDASRRLRVRSRGELITRAIGLGFLDGMERRGAPKGAATPMRVSDQP